jgi:NTE family protein
MLTIEPARKPSAGNRKLAIALAGGGPLGAFYELGVLHALGEAIEGRELTDFDVYVGVSSGALVASGLANGFDTTEMGAIFIEDESTQYPFTPGMLLQPAVGEYLHRAAQVPKVVTDMVREYAREPLNNLWPAAVGSLGKLVPTAVFDNAPLESYLRTAFSTNGHTDDFRELQRRLYLVATNLNTGESVRFGEPGHDRVPVSRAVCASTALPGLYPAVEIDGQFFVDGALIRTMNASLALEEGCRLVICINPLVPFDASRAPTRRNANLADEGLPAVLAQTFRALIHSRMQVGMASYRARFPQAETLLIEPDRNDEQLFFANVFRYAGRRRLVDHAYQCARRDLLAQADVLVPLLRRHGLELNTAILRERHRSFSSAGKERRARARSTTRRLDKALGRLEAVLAKSRAPA